MPLLVEIKARCADPDVVRKILLENKADYQGLDHQIDTYFIVDQGRLKLREGNIENTLIHYSRANQTGPKTSKVSLYKPNPGPAIKEVLTNALGVLIVVDKQREIYFIDNVKFHIDQVAQLGSFMEIEAIDEDNTIGQTELDRQCNYYMNLLGVDAKDLVSNSYSDMLMDVKPA